MTSINKKTEKCEIGDIQSILSFSISTAKIIKRQGSSKGTHLLSVSNNHNVKFSVKTIIVFQKNPRDELVSNN